MNPLNDDFFTYPDNYVPEINYIIHNDIVYTKTTSSRYYNKYKVGDMIGGGWTVIDDTLYRGSYGKSYLFAQCPRCNITYPVKVGDMERAKPKMCKQCQDERRRVGPFDRYMTNLKTSTQARNKGRKTKLTINITSSYIQELFESQNGKCALTGIPLKMATTSHSGDATASLDRIDSTRGYIKGNVQWVYMKVNFMKQNYSQSDFIELCQRVANHTKKETKRK